MGTPQTLAAQLAEAQADLAAVLGAEQRALEKAGNYRAMASEQDPGSLAERQYLNASVEQVYLAQGYAKHANELRELVRELGDRLDAETTAERDTFTLMGRLTLTAEQQAAVDDTAGLAA